MPNAPGNVTTLLIELRRGNKKAEEQLISLVYGELRRLAGAFLRKERRDHTLQPTALVNEAYLRLVEIQDLDWQSRSHFFAIAARLMRHILIDHARAHRARKRGGAGETLNLDDVIVFTDCRAEQFLALDEALERLSKFDARQSQIVELRFFAGFSEEETAKLLRVSPRTIKRDWRMAKAWLYKEITSDCNSHEF